MASKSDIEYLYIISKSGIPLFSVSYECGYGFDCEDLSELAHAHNKDNLFLFSGFISALFSMGEKFGGTIKHISMSNFNIHSFSTEKIIGIIVTKVSNIQEKINDHNNRIRVITELFFSEYKDKLHLEHQINLFKNFQKIIENNLLIDEDMRFKKNCFECTYDIACPFRIISGDINQSINEKIEQIPSNSSIIKLSQIIRLFNKYRPITADDSYVSDVFDIKTISFVNKSSLRMIISYGFGCNNSSFAYYSEKQIQNLKEKSFLELNTGQRIIVIEYPEGEENDLSYGSTLGKDVFIVIIVKYKTKTKVDINNMMWLVLKRLQNLVNEPDNEELSNLNIEVLNPNSSFECGDCPVLDNCMVNVFK